jgi:2-phosphosulfolactate phosphatase
MGQLEALFCPAEFDVLRQRELGQTVCVVFDVLRATSTMVTALANGAAAIVLVDDIPAALAIRKNRPEVLLAGERNGLRIRAALTGGVEFDLGNSPREFSAERVRGRTIVMTTTNGTRALRAAAGAQAVLVGAWLNLRAVAQWLGRTRAPNLTLVCSGTLDQAAYEDTLAAGALCELVWPVYAQAQVADSAFMARQLYRLAHANLLLAMQNTRNGRRLMAEPELRDDVQFCARRDVFDLVAALQPDGTVRRLAERH